MAIKLVVLDVDGVLCDGKIYNEDGKAVGKVFNDLDFTAIKCFKALNIPVIFLTSDPFNRGIANYRKIPIHVSRRNDNIIDKGSFIELFEDTYRISREEILYCGDDRFDLPFLTKVGWAFCPANSPNCVKDVCTVLKGRSGQNLVSEIFDFLVHHGIVTEPSLTMLQYIDSLEK